MFFNKEEVIIIESAIESYNEKHRMHLTFEAQKRYCEITLNKLKTYSFLTVFTKAEYSIMYLSLLFVIELADLLNESLDPIFYSLLERVGELADPEVK